MMNCLVEAAVQEAYKECGCYPGYLVLSNNTCFGDSFRCFRRVFNDLGIKVSDTYLQSSNCSRWTAYLQAYTGLWMTKERKRLAWRLASTRPSALHRPATTFRERRASTTDMAFASLSGPVTITIIWFLLLIDFSPLIRKLHVLTCPEKSMRKALEKRYPGLCDDVQSVMNVQGKCWKR